MKIELVFEDWLNKYGQSIYHTERGDLLSAESFNGGTVFSATIALDESEAQELKEALENDYRPVFILRNRANLSPTDAD